MPAWAYLGGLLTQIYGYGATAAVGALACGA